MSSNPATSRSAYQRSAVLTASQGQLIVMLYDGACRFLLQGSTAMSDRQFEVANNKLRRAEMIISHLQASLDYERGGDIAPRLYAIYAFCKRHLSQARIHGDPQRIEEVQSLLRTLRDAWSQVA
jgi:flagellar secretion chaperone FliS